MPSGPNGSGKPRDMEFDSTDGFREIGGGDKEDAHA
jgi:hypothetical protein